MSELRDRSAAEASSLLGEPRAGRVTPVATPAGAAAADPGAAPTGFRTPFRFESDAVLVVIDQRKLPDALVEMPVRSASDAANAIRLMVVRGAPAIGQVAAIGLALTARIAAKSQAHTRRAILEGAANQLRNARPTAINLRWAVERLMARYHEIGALSEDGEAIATALHDEAMAIVAEATDDHGRLAEAGLAILPGDGRPPAPGAHPLQHRPARVRPVRDGPRGRPGGPPCRAATPRLGRRDAAVSPGRPPHRVGAQAGRRPAHAHPGHGRRPAAGPRRGRRHRRWRGPDRGQR